MRHKAITPEQLAQATPASLGRRLAAMLYDTFLVVALLMAIGAAATYLYGDGIPASAHWYKVLNLFIVVTFYTFFWCRSGQTLGMRTWRLVALDTQQQAMRPGQVIIRALAALFSILLLGVGYFIMYWDPERRTLHERLSQTVTLFYPHPE